MAHSNQASFRAGVFKKISLCFLLFLSSGTFYAQKKKTKEKEKEKPTAGGGFLKEHKPHARDFHSLGHSLFFDLNLAPLRPYTVIKNYDTTTEYSRLVEYSLYHISYFLRFNLYEPDDERALTITMNPGLGLGLTESRKMKGFGIFTGGLLIGWEKGVGATYRSGEPKGRFIRLGAEYSYLPLVISSQEENQNEIKSWISPVLSFGFRKENAKQNLVETNFKIGWGFPKVDDPRATTTYVFYRPFSLRISMAVYFDH
jgi:hypothetical protein